MSTRRATAAVRTRGGMTLLEVLVVVAIALALLAVGIPVATSMFSLKQRAAAKKLALTYELLHDEAVLRNQTFRIAYHLDGGWYQVEMGDPTSLIFATPEERIAYERDRDRKLGAFSDGEAEDDDGFAAVSPLGVGRVELPGGTVFGGVWTPQYDDMVEPSGVEEDPEDPLVVYSYVFPSGYTEPTVVHLVSARDEDVGFSVVVEPMSGKVRLSTELVDERRAFDDVPDEGPELPQ